MGSAGSGRAGRIALFLAVLNLMMLGVGFGMEYVEANRMPAVSEFNAEKIRLWSQPDSYQPAPKSAPAIQSALAPPATAAPPSVSEAAPSQSAAEAAPAQPEMVQKGLCLAIADLSQSDYQDMLQLMKTSGLTGERCSYAFARRLAWWVFWPPEIEAAKREQALQAIRTAGVKDVLPITEGAMAQAFSVGVFSSESQARQYRNNLRSKGLDKIEYGPRPGNGPARLACQFEDPALLARFKTGLPVWAKPVDLSQCPKGAFSTETGSKPQ